MRTIGAFSNAVQHGTTCVTHDGICCEEEEEEEEEAQIYPLYLNQSLSSDSCLTL
jgi:hypothetical protein